jgi:hypothetical protein
MEKARELVATTSKDHLQMPSVSDPPFHFEGPLFVDYVVAGAGPGAAVAVPITFAYPQVSVYYGVLVEVNQAGVIATVSNKSTMGFTITLTPLPTITVEAVLSYWLFWGLWQAKRKETRSRTGRKNPAAGKGRKPAHKRV